MLGSFISVPICDVNLVSDLTTFTILCLQCLIILMFMFQLTTFQLWSLSNKWGQQSILYDLPDKSHLQIGAYKSFFQFIIPQSIGGGRLHIVVWQGGIGGLCGTYLPCQSRNFIKIKPARPMVIVPDQCGSNSPKIGLFFILHSGPFRPFQEGFMSALPFPVGGKQWVLTTEPKGFFITEEMKNILYQHDLALSNDVVNFEVDLSPSEVSSQNPTMWGQPQLYWGQPNCQKQHILRYTVRKWPTNAPFVIMHLSRPIIWEITCENTQRFWSPQMQSSEAFKLKR